jgi:hypothetical protein
MQSVLESSGVCFLFLFMRPGQGRFLEGGDLIMGKKGLCTLFLCCIAMGWLADPGYGIDFPGDTLTPSDSENTYIIGAIGDPFRTEINLLNAFDWPAPLNPADDARSLEFGISQQDLSFAIGVTVNFDAGVAFDETEVSFWEQYPAGGEIPIFLRHTLATFTFFRAEFDPNHSTSGPENHALSLRLDISRVNGFLQLDPLALATGPGGNILAQETSLDPYNTMLDSAFTAAVNKVQAFNLNSSLSYEGIKTNEIPEPATLALLAAGALGLLGYGWGRKRR